MTPACTFGRQKVDQHSHGGDEDTGHDDVDDVEERLALDDEVEDDLLVLGVIWGEVLRIDDFPSGAVLDGPFTILCRVVVPRESHHPAGVNGATRPLAWGREEVEGWCLVWTSWGTQAGHGVGKGARAAGEGDENCGVCQVPGQNTPKSCWRGQLSSFEASRAPRGLPGCYMGGWDTPVSLSPGCHGGNPSVTLGDGVLFFPAVCGSDRFFPIKIAARAGNEKINLTARKAFCSFNMQLKCDGKRHRLAVTATFPASIKLPGAVLFGSGCQAARAWSWGSWGG